VTPGQRQASTLGVVDLADGDIAALLNEVNDNFTDVSTADIADPDSADFHVSPTPPPNVWKLSRTEQG
jgi:hypothetical protein